MTGSNVPPIAPAGAPVPARRRDRTRRTRGVVGAGLIAVVLAGTALTAAVAAPTGALSPGSIAARNTIPPNLSVLLAGYSDLWTASGRGDLHGTVKDAAVLQHNDELAVWINQHATPAEQFLALQDAQYDDDGGTYDQSMTIATGLGSIVGPAYLKGRISGRLPLTAALINSSSGTSGAFVSTGTPKGFYSYPRPFLPGSATEPLTPGDAIGCSPSVANGSSLAALRVGQPYADARGDLDITRVAPTIDRTHVFSPNDVSLDAAYGTTGVGGRIDGEAALAARWSDADYRTEVLLPARAELLAYLRTTTGHDLAWNVAHQTPYASDPYGGAVMPGGTAQIVTDRASALAVFTERMTYGCAPTGRVGRASSVPVGASNLLLTTFPTLTDAQRTAVLAQTEIASGSPLDQTGTTIGSWQRVNLAAAMSATVAVKADGSVTVTATGGRASVVR